MILKIAAQSDVGCLRANNEDIALVQTEFVLDAPVQTILNTTQDAPVILAVSDGMGGHVGGEVASRLVVEKLLEWRNAFSSDVDYQSVFIAIEKWITETNYLINQHANTNGLQGMGATLVAVVFTSVAILAINIGDSRLYVYRNGWLRQITRDHSLRNLTDKANIPSNIIYNFLGVDKPIFADYFNLEGKIQDDDVLLLCSDGLSDMLSDEKIEEILKMGGSTRQLIEEAKKEGGKDNITAILTWINDEKQ